MEETKLIRLLKTFSGGEWKKFEKFAASPYFNGGRNYMPLVKELKKFSPGFESPRLTKEHLYGKIYPGKPFKETVVNTMLSGIYSLAEEFLVQHQLNNLPERPAMLIREFTKRKLFKDAEKIIDLTGLAGPLKNDFNSNYNSIAYNAREILEFYVLTDRRHLITEMLNTVYRFYIYDFINHSLTNKNIHFLNRKFTRKPQTNMVDEISGLIDFPKIIEHMRKRLWNCWQNITIMPLILQAIRFIILS